MHRLCCGGGGALEPIPLCILRDNCNQEKGLKKLTVVRIEKAGKVP